MRSFIAAALLALSAAPASALTVNVTGEIVGNIKFLNFGEPDFELAPDDPALENWRLDEMLGTNSGSLELVEDEYSPGLFDLVADNCTGLLLVACEGGVAYDTRLSEWDGTLTGNSNFGLQFDTSGLDVTTDAEDAWTNATGTYGFTSGEIFQIRFDSFEVVEGGVTPVPLPAGGLLLMSALALLGRNAARSKEA